MKIADRIDNYILMESIRHAKFINLLSSLNDELYMDNDQDNHCLEMFVRSRYDYRMKQLDVDDIPMTDYERKFWEDLISYYKTKN